MFGAPAADRPRSSEDVIAQAKSPPPTAKPDDPGAAIYATACAGCHETNRPLPYGGVDLALSTVISASDPRNAANIVLSGIRPVEGERSPIMPAFADSMNDRQISSFLNFLRARFSRAAGMDQR